MAGGFFQAPIYLRDAAFVQNDLRSVRLSDPGLDAPFFIVGCGRSGNTLMRRLLVENLDVYIPPETYVLGPTIKRIIRRPWMKFNRQVEYICSQMERHPDFKHFPAPSLHDVQRKLCARDDAMLSTAHIFDAIYRFWGRTAGVSFRIWGDKTPYNSYFLPQLNLTFPSAKYIWLVRDPYDVVLSYLEAGIYSSAESAAERWVASNKQIMRLSRIFPPLVYSVRYEKLVRNSNKIISPIGAWLGAVERSRNSLDMTEQFWGDVGALGHHQMVLQPVSSNRIGRGRASFSVGEKDKIRKVVGKLARKLDYDP